MRALNLDGAYNPGRGGKSEISGEDILRQGIQISSDDALREKHLRAERAARIKKIIQSSETEVN